MQGPVEHTVADRIYSCFAAGSEQKTADVNPAKHDNAAPRTYNHSALTLADQHIMYNIHIMVDL